MAQLVEYSDAAKQRELSWSFKAMKYFPSLFLHYLRKRATRRNLRVLVQFMATLVAMVSVYSVMFHYLMAWEGREYSWVTGVYWTLTVMSTLGFGDITFDGDLGRAFSIVVLMSGLLFLLVLLPFTLIELFYEPWVKAQAEAEGLDRVFRDAGFEWRLPGCSMCVAMNGDTLAPGERSASTSNRNFRGRMGNPNAQVYLGSPAVVASAAVAGEIVDPADLLEERN